MSIKYSWTRDAQTAEKAGKRFPAFFIAAMSYQSQKNATNVRATPVCC
jgi:hypothetical protein